MKRFQFLQYAAAALASLGFVLPSGVFAAEAPTPSAPAATAAATDAAPLILDVSLGDGGMLRGQVVNGEGTPLAQTLVVIRSGANDSASTLTDRQGYFVVQGLHGGLYEVSSAGGSGMFRVWTAAASPPSANRSVLIVAGGDVNRGQCCCQGPCRCGKCQRRCDPGYGGPRVPGWPTNGQVVLGVAVVLGIAGGI
ncbi:MAG TPA: carboxypeptidase-like regulatory domain-containing protein, partial [Pirellulales bacterium]|nr:carboxypeptidase-like regulatory domain-containing protein [Pirellulales bacterium]